VGAGRWLEVGRTVPVEDMEDAEEESPSSSSNRGGSGGRLASLVFAKTLAISLMAEVWEGVEEVRNA
jgi:hypothetical protein